MPLFALEAVAAESLSGWGVVQSLSVLLALALSSIAFIRQVSGKGGERQVEPTVLSALSDKIDALGSDIATLNREIGEVKTTGQITREAVEALSSKQSTQISGAHQRIDRIADEVSEHRAKIASIEKHCPRCVA